MKYALLAIAGSLGMGLSIIADSMGRNDDIAEYHAYRLARYERGTEHCHLGLRIY